MYKTPENPLIEELTKSYRERNYALGELKPRFINNVRLCIWCAKPLDGKKRKWCSEECSDSAMAWANPQKEWGLNVILARQQWKCNVCQYDYMPLIQDLMKRGYVYNKPQDYNTQFCASLITRIKQWCPSDRKPEVDHIIPISKGGTAIGLENHQCLCFSCHKAKTKLDNSGPRKK